MPSESLAPNFQEFGIFQKCPLHGILFVHSGVNHDTPWGVDSYYFYQDSVFAEIFYHYFLFGNGLFFSSEQYF
jgi:hypothetical protein